MSKLEIIYPERTPIKAVKAMDCGRIGSNLVASRHGQRILIHCTEGDGNSIILELDERRAARLFRACLTMTGPAHYEEGERQP